MLAYISIGVALCSIAVCLVFVLTWVYLGHEIRHSALLQEEFGTAVRRLIGTMGVFLIPIVAYFLDGTVPSNLEPQFRADAGGSARIRTSSPSAPAGADH
jgi:hypothetical protein